MHFTGQEVGPAVGKFCTTGYYSTLAFPSNTKLRYHQILLLQLHRFKRTMMSLSASPPSLDSSAVSLTTVELTTAASKNLNTSSSVPLYSLLKHRLSPMTTGTQ